MRTQGAQRTVWAQEDADPGMGRAPGNSGGTRPPFWAPFSHRCFPLHMAFEADCGQTHRRRQLILNFLADVSSLR